MLEREAKRQPPLRRKLTSHRNVKGLKPVLQIKKRRVK